MSPLGSAACDYCILVKKLLKFLSIKLGNVDQIV